MTRVLLTGGNGFIASHVLDNLLQRGHSVVVTVRNSAKVDQIKMLHPEFGKERLDFATVHDIAVDGAFDDAIKSDPPFEAVIHTASPFHYNVTDIQKELLDPAIVGTTGILKSIMKYAPAVKRVVITSSFAAISNASRGAWPEHTYSEADWNPMTLEKALEKPTYGYTASKLFAERAAWDFVEQEKPGFTITTLCPPLVFGPIKHVVDSLDTLNTSNKIISMFPAGAYKAGIPPTIAYIWIDVRDLALGHCLAMEKPEAGGQRYFFVAGHYTNKEIADVVRNNFLEFKTNLPGPEAQGGDFPKEGIYQVDNTRARELLGRPFTPIGTCIVDTIQSIKPLLPRN